MKREYLNVNSILIVELLLYCTADVVIHLSKMNLHLGINAEDVIK